MLACAKHFAGYSETQGGRDASEADISPRKLRSWFLPPFERVAREGCRTFMLGYQSMDGVPITANRWLLNDVLKGEWGFTGMLVTDWDNVGRMVWEQKVCADYAEAAAVAVRAGNDLVMTTPRVLRRRPGGGRRRACWPRPRSTPPSGGSCGSSSSSACSRTRARRRTQRVGRR